ncbi:MAG: RHS repeat-associated core domain-containing protein [Bryobacteraceae bacterium]
MTRASFQPADPVRAAAPLTPSGFGNVYRFTGRRFDDATGLYYYRNRYYEPASGRFINRDPLGYPDSMNACAYVRNNPVNRFDPLGLREPPPILRRFLTYVDEVEDALGRTEVYYRVSVVCECRNGKWKMHAGYSLYYRILIEKRFRKEIEEQAEGKPTSKGVGIYGHELKHVAAVERAVVTDRALHDAIARARTRDYGNKEKDCTDAVAREKARIEGKLKEAITKGVGHAARPGMLRPQDKTLYQPPGGWVEPPTSEADFERERRSRERRGYKQYIPGADTSER